MKILRFLLALATLFAVGATVYLVELYNIQGFELFGMIVISILTVFVTVTIHAFTQSTTRNRDMYVPTKIDKL